jgi:Tfp pilus assembly ATPase PilU
MKFNDLLKMLVEKEGSDLFLTTGAPPSIKAYRTLTPLVEQSLPEGLDDDNDSGGLSLMTRDNTEDQIF